MDQLKKTFGFLVKNGGFTVTSLSNYLTEKKEVTNVLTAGALSLSPKPRLTFISKEFRLTQ